MKVSFICNYIAINDGWSPWDTRIGGSEEFIVEVSKRLEDNHDVMVYHNGQHGVYHGVTYRDHSEYRPGDITINVNYPEFKPQGKTIYWTSLDKNPDLKAFDAVCVISQYQRDNCHIEHKNIHLVPPGYDPEKIYPDKKVSKQCFYASSPDRGLNTLLEAWPSVVAAHPDATLLLTYGAPPVSLPGVISLGEVDEDTINEIYRTSDIWCHPANGGELYCMTGIKAQAARCWPVIIPIMALDETVEYGTFSTKQDYAQDLIATLDAKREAPSLKYPTWQDTTNKLEELIQSVYSSN